MPAAITACALTDGDFVNRFQPPVDTGCVPDDLGQGCGSARADRVLTVDLDTARPASLLVVRGITADVVAELSVDGESWAGVEMDGIVGSFIPATSARYIRLRSKTDNGGLPLSLTELSLWCRRPQGIGALAERWRIPAVDGRDTKSALAGRAGGRADAVRAQGSSSVDIHGQVW